MVITISGVVASASGGAILDSLGANGLQVICIETQRQGDLPLFYVRREK